MNNRFETVSTAVRHAEEALKALDEFYDIQHETKGEEMADQIAHYIANTLSNANYMCCGCKHNHLSLSNMKDCFVFYIYDNSVIGTGIPVISITKSGEVKYFRKLSEWMMLNVINDWSGFKKELDFAIRTTLRERTNHINNQLSHIVYVNEQLSKWTV